MKILCNLGENITLAMKRRGISQEMMSRRAGISKPTLRKITKGDPSVSIGHYVNVLAVLADWLDIRKPLFVGTLRSSVIRGNEHGRKSSSRTINGYKQHIAIDMNSKLILATCVCPANAPEHQASARLKPQSN